MLLLLSFLKKIYFQFINNWKTTIHEIGIMKILMETYGQWEELVVRQGEYHSLMECQFHIFQSSIEKKDIIPFILESTFFIILQY